MNIDRPGGFPLCAETLGVLDENSMMLTALLAEIPLDRRQAVMFGQYLLVCDQWLRKRVVKAGANRAASLEQCKLVFHTENHSVHDGHGSEIADVWSSETADIADEDSPALQWRIFSLDEVFAPGLWRDRLPAFSAGLPSAAVSAGSFISLPQLHGDGNIMRANNERLQVKVAVAVQLNARSNGTMLSIPVPSECPDGTRQEVDIEMVTTRVHYSARSCFKDGMLWVNIGSWLKDSGIWTYDIAAPIYPCSIIIRINREVIL